MGGRRGAEAVIAFGLLLRIKLEQVKSRITVTAGCHKCFHPAACSAALGARSNVHSLIGTLGKWKQKHTGWCEVPPFCSLTELCQCG